MGFILLGIALFFLSLIFGAFIKMAKEIAVAISIVALVICLIIGICVPVTEYVLTDEIVVENVCLEYNFDRLVGVYWYTSSDNDTMQQKYISVNEVSIKEDASIEEPKLITSVYRGKMTFWSFAIVPRVEYILYVPVGTITSNK